MIRRCPCGKRSYPSVRAARRANSQNSHRLRAYFCPVGHVYHVTKRDGRSCRLRETQSDDDEAWAA